MKKKISYVADFETRSELFYNAYGYTEIYLWNLCKRKSYTHQYGTDIYEFLKVAFEGEKEIFFHNLDFDIQFIYYALENLGYSCVLNEELLLDKTYCIQKNHAALYSVIVCHKASVNIKKGKEVVTRRTTVFRDSLKLLNYSVLDIGKKFGLSVHKKFDQNYYDKEKGKDYLISEEDIAGCKADCEVVARALDIQEIRGFTKNTLAGCAFDAFKHSFVGDIPLSEKNIDRIFEDVFPPPSGEIDSYIRKAFSAGITQVKRACEGKLFNRVFHYDVNGLYPYVYSSFMLPYGMPIFYKGEYEPDEEYPLYIQHFICSFKLRDEKIPMIQKNKTAFRNGFPEYMHDSDGCAIELFLCSYDLMLFFECYEVEDLEYIDGLKFKGDTSIFAKHFAKYSSQKMQGKRDGDRVGTQIAKDMLNMVWGRFTLSPIVEEYLMEETEDGKLVPHLENKYYSKSVYPAMGVFICGAAHQVLCNAINANYENFLYCDTDSMFLTEPAKGVIIDSVEPGAWACEHSPYISKFIALQPKRYLLEFNGKAELTCCGMRKEEQAKFCDKTTFDEVLNDFHYGYKTFQNKKINVKGGAIIAKRIFELRGT